MAWAALGDTEKWWQPGNDPGFYWPKDVLDDGSFQSYVELFTSLGYKTINSTNRHLEVFHEKVAIFASPDGDFSHVSYQLFFRWMSKLGEWEDIRHITLEGLEGDDYGGVNTIMKRRSGIRGFLARLSFGFTSHIWPLKRPN